MTQKMQARSKSAPVGVLIGVLTAALSMILGAVIISALISKEIIKYEALSYFIMALTAFSVMVGGFTGVLILKKHILVVSLSIGLLLLVTLLSGTAMFFEGNYTGVPATAALVVGCSLATALISIRTIQQPETYRRKR